MRAIFLADGKVFTTGFSRMSERQLALWDPVSGHALPEGAGSRQVPPWARRSGVTVERPVVPGCSAWHLRLSGPGALPPSLLCLPVSTQQPFQAQCRAPPPGSLPALP